MFSGCLWIAAQRQPENGCGIIIERGRKWWAAKMFAPRLLRLAGKPCAVVAGGFMRDGFGGDGYLCAMGTE